MSENPKCIVCGKPIKKTMKTLTFLPATDNGRENYTRDDRAYGTYLYLDEALRPKTVEEAKRYTNHPITKAAKSGDRIISLTWWEGEYDDAHFHAQQCAAAFGRRMAKAGYR